MTSAMRELAAISHDIRKIGFRKLPRNIERAAVIFMRGKSHLNLEGSKESLKFGKLAKYMYCEVFVMTDATVDDFIEVMRHFVTETKQVLLCFTVANKVNDKSSTGPTEIPFVGGSVDPELLFDLGNSIQAGVKLFYFIDGINDPKNWDPKANGSTKPGLYFMAPYADTKATDIIQFDSNQEGFFSLHLNKVIKAFPEESFGEIARVLEEQIEPFGLKVFAAANPPSALSEKECFV
ncbi:hypothetical protein TVAG_224360 [Trichomonas vaginalis G3]|uniref:Uncharacterized protein n=1 Tax=Trichomonas vaginalis (strain ATCC PRA-98 / G3) TaxID=412133 RepID=A2DW59_TRIV3|nr:hypothetical protein TVAGG3_0804720 [Trichomonas vaginalis G3]EAY15360.1 hypothetical protein TVAG_224360 [Trichomonas vaginalis G3]KAI5496774.1 hypothetical protein TVAGG3_0804720 [Trichomonas vaginalis G3]|eukprot:XP_001327583.1 hypothetical protein [Trichomonas vaginalis G3]